MGVSDFRLQVGFSRNPKIKKLHRRHGAEAVFSLIKLWEFAAEHRNKGVLYDMDAEDIVSVVDHPGDTEWVSSLCQLGFLVEKDSVYELKDWAEHQPWVIGADKRSEAARKAAMKKWGMKNGQ